MDTKLEDYFAMLKSKRNEKKNSVVYYPKFTDATELTNHFYRASWYLPHKEGVLEKVILPTESKINVDKRPTSMGESRSNIDHIEARLVDDYEDLLANASCILLWNYPDDSLIEGFQKLGIKVFNITTNDESTVEYGNYCKLLWQMNSSEEKDTIIESSHARFKSKFLEIKQKGYLASALFGTGPSIDLADKYDFSRCFTHVCNTVILSDELMAIIQPNFISAGDVVSHFGVSAYAHEFREKLHQTLQEKDCMFLTTSQFGYLFMVHYPDVAEKVLVCDQRGFPPNYDLLNDWNLPCLDSVFNIHMAPTCATISDIIFVLGCDGKNPDEKRNEDFWEHSKQAQLHDLVDTGHECHPTFDIHRQKSTWTGYQNSVKQTCGIGENLFGKKYISLEPSYTIGLEERYFPTDELNSLYPFIAKA